MARTRKDAGRHSPEVGVVGKIEKFRPKLQTPLGIHKELALDGKVNSEDRRRDQRVAANIPYRSRLRNLENTRIEIQLGGSEFAAGLDRITTH